jgi:protoporphyrinogen oxidase
MKEIKQDNVILGAGPAGLAAAYELSKYGMPVTVIDRLDEVGGLCRTVNYQNFLFDIGGHRFLSKSVEVNAFWKHILGDALILKNRKSRIYFSGKFFDYPLKAHDALIKLGFLNSLHFFFSYVYAQIFPPKKVVSFEDWMIKRFGLKLYQSFFKTYTEKVWGVSCKELSSDWAEQRIQELSLLAAVLRAFNFSSSKKIKTLSDTFLYPRKGPGQFCEALKHESEVQNASYLLGREIVEILHSNGKINAIKTKDALGCEETIEGKTFFSSIPVNVMIGKMKPEVPKDILNVAKKLKFRAFISVNLIYAKETIFDDHWIYIHSPTVKVGRIQNYKNWSDEMVPDSKMTSLGAEYFVNHDDELWNMDDRDLVQLAVDELDSLEIAPRDSYLKGFVVRNAHAYPVYLPGYQENVAQLHGYLSSFSNLQVMGRAGLFRYNNSDHAILTGLAAARNIMGESHDLWKIDPDHNKVSASRNSAEKLTDP